MRDLPELRVFQVRVKEAAPFPPAGYAGPATLYREANEIVFEGDGGWTHHVPLEQVATDESMEQVIDLLRTGSWMTDALCEQFRTEVLWLRQQLPPGK